MLDLGCAVGEQSALLAARGCQVLGLDGDRELLAAARARSIAGATFEYADLRDPVPAATPEVDGVWCSFVPAYFPDLDAFVLRWSAKLRPGGWIALVEVDDFFAHEPLPAAIRALLEGFVAQSAAADLYDFRAGRKLAGAVARAGLTDIVERVVADDELSFHGPASPEVRTAWAQRLDRMRGLQAFAGASFSALREALLSCLAAPDHRSGCRVLAVRARRPA